MKVRYHVAASGIISSVVYFTSNSLLNAAASFLTGVLIDLDHFVDYYLNCGISYNLKEIYEALEQLRLKKIYLFLHSFEILFMLWLLIFLIPLKSVYLAIAIGFTQHMLFDLICNPVNARGYFLSYRLKMGFKREAILKPNLLFSTDK